MPIAKVHPPSCIETDLRPISLTPTLSKLLESYVGNWMLTQVTRKLDQKQFGALRGRSTTHALVDMLHAWHQAIDQSHIARVVFVDFSKAFDRLDHTVLMNNLIQLGIHGSVLKWFSSFLIGRQQRVKVAGCYSSWLVLKGGMPQGSWLGPFAFIVLINTLRLSCQTHKYIDDTTLTEILYQNQLTSMDFYLSELSEWSLANHMHINYSKTKEMIITSSRAVSLPALSNIERVDVFKLLGVFVSADLRWNRHINYIAGKANSRLHFLRQIKRAAVSVDQMLYFYIAYIRPVLEYAAPVWHTGLTTELSDQLESLQKRALRIIYGGSSFTNYTYEPFCEKLGILTLHARREELSKNFFIGLFDPASCLHHLIPGKRENLQTEKLRKSVQYQIPFARTNRFRNSLILYGLYHYL